MHATRRVRRHVAFISSNFAKLRFSQCLLVEDSEVCPSPLGVLLTRPKSRIPHDGAVGGKLCFFSIFKQWLPHSPPVLSNEMPDAGFTISRGFFCFFLPVGDLQTYKRWICDLIMTFYSWAWFKLLISNRFKRDTNSCSQAHMTCLSQ